MNDELQVQSNLTDKENSSFRIHNSSFGCLNEITGRW